MKKVIAVLLMIFQVSNLAMGAACCAGGGPKSFISLQELQAYEVGFQSSVRNVFGNYDAYGEAEESDRNQTWNLSFGVGARFAREAEAFLIIPFALQINGIACKS